MLDISSLKMKMMLEISFL